MHPFSRWGSRLPAHARSAGTPSQASQRSRAAARALLALACALAAGASATAATAQAAGTPNLQLSGGPASSVLYGHTIPVDLTASLPPGEPKGYNLAYRAVLPAGTSYVPGSASALDGEPTILANAPTTGRTTLIWENVDDLVANSSHTLSFRVAYNDTSSAGTPRYDVGDLIAIDSGAYISTDPRDETDFDGIGVPQGPGAGTYTGKAEQTTNTELTAIQVEKSEPHPEGEIPRGVHDHQTVYTLTVTNNTVNPTNAVSLEDYIPAGLEFLGCAGTPDHTFNSPTNGAANEYPGAPLIVVTHPTAAEHCTAPDVVETVNLDPDGAGPLPSAVYTHIKLDAIGNFAPGDVRVYTYGAAIPIRENTMTWTGPTVGTTGPAPATTGAQAVNLDNNSGPETYDEQPLLNGAIVKGTYVAPAKPPKAVSDEGTLLRTAEDIAIQKSNDNAGLDQGDLTKWTIDLQVSEYRSVDDITIHDVVPDGLCPLGPVNEEHTPPAGQAECDPVAAKNPSDPYTTVDEQPNGTFDITWDKTTMPSLAHVKPSETRQLHFWTRTREHYQENFADAAPVLSRDSVSNAIDTTGTDWVRCTTVAFDCAGSGPKIDHDEVDGEPDLDVSGAGKAATGPSILKQVAATYPASGDCNDLPAAAYGKTVPVYGPGDLVCWKLRLDFPNSLNTTSQDVFDILPVGVAYVPGTSQTTAADTVPVGPVDPSTPGRLRWPIGTSNDVDHGGQVFEVTFKATVGSVTGHHSGDVEGNLMKFSYENTATTAFTLRDRADFALKLPELALVKGVRQVNAGPIFGPNSDHKQVRGADNVQYRVDVTNNGTADASSSRIWDQLPTGITCADVQLGSISDGGSCNPAGPRIEWSAIPVAQATTKTLTYTVKIPTGVSPDVTFVNTAGVVEFSYTSNDGDTFQFVPDNPVVRDPSLPAPNAPAAQDVSDVFTPPSAIVKTRTTSVNESGNDSAAQATIGETVNYTVTTTIPAGTTMYGTPTVTDDLGARQAYVPGSLTAKLNGVNLPTAGVSATVAGNVITTTFPSPFANPTGDDVLVLTFKATVLDVNANIRGAALPNTTTLAFRDQAGNPVSHASTVNTTLVEPMVTLDKSHTPAGKVSPGQIIDFRVKVTNPNTANVSTAHDLVVVDTLPVGTDPVDAGGNPIADGGAVPTEGGIWNATARTITWDRTTTPAFLTALVPGGSRNLSYKVKLESTPVSGQTYVNTAVETSKSLDGSVPGVRTPSSTASTAPDYTSKDSETLAVVLPAVTKDVTPDEVTVGNRVTWHVHVTLPKSVQYFDTTIVDTVPSGFDVDGYGAATCVSGCLGSDPAVTTFPVTSAGAGRLQAAWYVGDVAPSPDDRVYDLVLTGHVRDTYINTGAKVLNTQTLTNSVVVKTNRTNTVGGTPSTVPSGPYDDTVGPATSKNHVVEPNLTITKAASKGPIVEGSDHLTYTVAVKNTGTSPAYDVVVDDQPDSELTNVVLATGAALNSDPWTAGDPHMRWVIPGPIAVGDTVTLTYTADVKPGSTLSAGQTIVNTAKVVEYYGVPKSTRDADGFVYRKYTGPQATVTLTVALPTLSIVKTPDHGAATAGSPSSFTIKVTNSDANATAHNVVVHDVLQAGLGYASGSATASPAAGFSETGAVGQTIDWKIATLAPGATVTITVPVSVDGNASNGSTLLNTASTHADEVPTDKTDTGSLDVSTRADLQVTKTSDHDPTVPGTNVAYTLVVRNNGPSDALASTLTDTLPSYLTFVSLDDPAHCSTAGQLITCAFGTLAKGDTRTVHVTAKLDPSRTAAISNTADVTTTTTDTDPSNDHSTAPNAVNPTADVSITKTADKAVYQGGDTVTYTLVAHNGGPSDAQNVTIDDDIPAQLSFVSVSPGTPTCTQAAGHVHCNVGTLAPGADRTVTIVTTAHGTPPPAAGSSNTHKITVGKVEQSQSLQAGQTKSYDVTCASGGYASDGAVEVMHVDQGTGSPADVQVLDAHSTAPGTYHFVVRNTTTGQAQVKLFVTCLPHDTDLGAHTHPLDVGALQTLATGSLAPGRYTFTIPTSAAHRVIAPGIEVLSGQARLAGGEPAGNGWRFTVEVLQTATANLSIRALSDFTGPGGSPAHVHQFSFQHIVSTVSLPPGESVQRVSCPTNYKGITATYDLPAGIVSLGNEPQPINRDFRLLNTTGASVTVTLDLECMAISTGAPGVSTSVVNTGTVATPTFDPAHGNDTSAATIVVSSAAAI